MLHSVFCRTRPVGGDRVRGRERCGGARGTACLLSLEGVPAWEEPTMSDGQGLRRWVSFLGIAAYGMITVTMKFKSGG